MVKPLHFWLCENDLYISQEKKKPIKLSISFTHNEVSVLIYQGGNSISKADWLTLSVKQFEMSVKY